MLDITLKIEYNHRYIMTKGVNNMKNSRNMFRIVSGILAFIMSASLMVSCAESADGNSENTPENPNEVQTEAEETDDGIERDRIPEDLTFDGADLRMAGQAYHVTNNMDMWVESATGDVVLDAIYERGLYVEERLKCKITEPLMTTYENCSSTIKNMVNAQEDGYEIVVNQLATTSSDVLNGYYINLNDVPYIDFERSWYPQEITESAALGGKLFLTVSDMCLTYVGQTWSMFFEKDKCADYGLEDLYEVARGGQWTIDKLTELTRDIYQDLNGNGKADNDDLYGFTFGSGLDGCKAAAFMYGAGARFLTVDQDDYSVEHLLGSERNVQIGEKFYDLNHQEGSHFFSEGNAIDSMLSGNVVFGSAQLGHYYSYARDYEGTFGVLPLPKYDEQQDGYYTLCDAGCNCITVPITCVNTELAGAAVEAMSAYSHNYVNPAYVSIALQTKIARDEESAEMMDLVLDGRVMDFGYLYCGWNGWTWQLGNMLKDPNKYVSTFEKNMKSQSRYYDKVIACFGEE